MIRLTSGGRLERLLSIVPWVVAHDGPTIAEIAERFDYPQDRLVADLNDILFMVGLYPFTPDQLIEVVVEHDRVWIHYAEYFERPLRLTPEQGLALVTAGSTLLAVPGADPTGPLARGLAKLAATLGVTPGTDLEVNLGDADPAVLATIRDCIADHHQMSIEYYAYGRDELTRRTVDPYRVVSNQGQWYLLAHCHMAEGERLFRVDRIHTIDPLDATFEAGAHTDEVGVFEADKDDPRITLLLRPPAFWVIEAHPVESVETLSDGTKRVTLAISAMPWLERLLLRLGSDAKIDSASTDLPPDILRTTAERILARYSRPPQ